jgi:thymidylate kinase
MGMEAPALATRLLRIDRPVSTREKFVRSLFTALDRQQISYVVLRNFDTVFTGVDLDILCEKTPPVLTAAREAAAQVGYSLVQQARFVNWSFVWWDGRDDFLRLDVENAVRWRLFQPLATSTILAARIRRDSFWIPAPAHEAECLRVHLAGGAKSAERYKRRLAELGEAVTDTRHERCRLLVTTLVHPRRWPAALGFLATDARRLVIRWRHPVGALLDVASTGAFPSRLLRKKLSVLFPESKGKETGATLKELRTALFRGGLVIRHFSKSDPDVLVSHLRSARLLGSNQRQFQLLQGSQGSVQMAHLGTGFMQDSAGTADTALPSRVAAFMCRMLARGFEPQPPRRGSTLLLLGVDGAGKTSVARRLMQHAKIQDRFCGVRYFHWIPGRKTDFPWPVLSEQPRNVTSSCPTISIIRLLRNLLRARLAWMRTVQPLVKSGYFVVLDRFLANYWLDPLSVKYAGPRHLLTHIEPYIPKADLMVVLDASADVILSRKRELSAAQIEEQREHLRAIPLLARRRLDLDASRSIEAIVEAISQEATNVV